MADRYVRCSFCGRSIRVRPSDGVLYKHDNHNNSGYCKGSLMFVAPALSGEKGRTMTPCLGCGHAQRNHINGQGLCTVQSCRMCLVYRPSPGGTSDA